MAVDIRIGDCLKLLRAMPDESVHMCVTSPPYFGLRDYNVAGQIGLEKSVGAHIAKLVEVFREVRRVLRKDGTLWVNYGDAYCSGTSTGRNPTSTKGAHVRASWSNRSQNQRSNPPGYKPKDRMMLPARLAIALQDDGWWLRDEIVWAKPNPMPSSVQDRTTPAHEMLYMFSKSRRYFYDAEAIKEPMADSSVQRLTQPSISDQKGGDKQDQYEAFGLNDRTGSRRPNEIVQGLAARRGGKNENMRWDAGEAHRRLNNQGEKMIAGEKWGARHEGWEAVKSSLGGRNKRSVWTIATEPFNGARLMRGASGEDKIITDHFAVFPTALVEPCILAGTSQHGCCAACGAPWVRSSRGTNSQDTTGWSPICKCDASVLPCIILDPFGGAGTTGLVADRLGRNAILIELNAAYCEMARRRIFDDAPLLAAQ